MRDLMMFRQRRCQLIIPDTENRVQTTAAKANLEKSWVRVSVRAGFPFSANKSPLPTLGAKRHSDIGGFR